MSKCLNPNDSLVKAYQDAVGEDLTYQLFYENDFNLPDYKEHPLFTNLSENLSDRDTIKSIVNLKLKSPEVNYSLKATEILQSKKAEQIFEKGKKNKWNLKKILTELQIPKEQKQIILDTGLTDRSEIVTELATNYSYTVETKLAEITAIQEEQALYAEFAETDEFGVPLETPSAGIVEGRPTQYYSSLTVPGGTNYTENRIVTPQITPIIKGHAQFAENNDIGWFRSDDKADLEFREDLRNESPDVLADLEEMGISTPKKTPTNTRRILEFQSDLFQKGRGKKDLAGEVVVEDVDFDDTGRPETTQKLLKDAEGNQFLQLLMKKNNWQTFFIKSIVQDSAKKGYEKVLFPKGDTIAKIEGHQTLERFKKEKQNRLKQVENNIKSYVDGNLIVHRHSTFGFDDKTIFPFDESENLAVATKDITDKIKPYLTGKTGQTKGGWNYSVLSDSIKKVLAEKQLEKAKREKETIEKELKDVEEQGFAVLNKVGHFYENTVTNILNKQFDNVEVVTDEYGNAWNEVSIDRARDISPILFRLSDVIPVTNENIEVLGLDQHAPNEYAEISRQLLPEITERQDVQFLKERFPDAPVDFYEGIQHVGSQVAHGYMKNAAFHIWTNSEVGTAYHEAFHGLTQLYFNDAKRNSLYDVASQEYNLDRSNELALEERLAEDFRNYMLLQENASIPAKILQFIKSLYYYVKALVTDSVTIDQAYTMLETGRIPQRLKRNMERFNPGGTLYSLRPGYTETVQRDVLNSIFDIYERQRISNLKLEESQRKSESDLMNEMDHYFFSHAFSERDGSPIQKDAKAKVLDVVDAMKKKDINRLKELAVKYNLRHSVRNETPAFFPSNDIIGLVPQSMFPDKSERSRKINEIRKHYLDVALNWETSKARKEDIKEGDKNKTETGNFTNPGWKDIFVDFLPEYGYEYSESDSYIGDAEVQERIFDRSHFEESMRDKMGGRIKALLATIPEGTGITVMGTPRRVNPAKVYNDILQVVSHSRTFNEMIESLRRASEYKPYLNNVIDRIQDLDNNDKAQFRVNFYQHYQDFMTMRVYPKGHAIFTSNRNNLKVKVQDEWRADAFSDPQIQRDNIYFINADGDITLHTNRAMLLHGPLEVLQKLTRDQYQQAEDIHVRALTDLIQGLSIGLNIPLKRYLDSFVTNGIQIGKRNISGKDLIISLYKGVKDIASEIVDVKFENDGTISSFELKQNPNNYFDVGTHKETLSILANLQSNFETNIVESFLSADKKAIYPYNMSTQLSDIINDIKKGDYFTDDYLADTLYNPTGLSEHMSPLVRLLHENDSVRETLIQMKFDAFQTKSNEADTYKDQGEKLSNITRMMGFLNQGNPDYAYFPLPTQSDRDYLAFIPLPRVDRFKSFGLTDISGTKEIIRNDLLSQIANYQQAEQVQKGHIKNYHEINGKPGNVFRLTGLLDGLKWKKIDGVLIHDININELIENNQFDSIVEEYLSEFGKEVNEIAKNIESYLLESQTFSNDNGQFLNSNGKPVNSFKTAQSQLRGKSLRKYDTLFDFARDYTLQSMIMNNEIQKIFYQGRDFYANLDDFYKRAGLLTTPGLRPVIRGEIAPDWGLKENISEIIINDVYNKGDDSAIYEYAKYVNRNKSKEDSWAEDYAPGATNKTDAQGFMSIHGYKDWLQAFGEWTDSHQQAYDNYTTFNHETGKWGEFVDNEGTRPSISPIKPSVVGHMSITTGDQKKIVPVSIKNSYVVLLREYTNVDGKPLRFLDNLRQRMELEGKYDQPNLKRIDWANTESTHKMFQSNVVDITQTSDLSNVTSHFVPAKLVRVPQVKPEKKSNSILMASQPLRLITTKLNNITLPYKLKKGDLTRDQWLDAYHQVVSRFVNDSITEIQKELQYSPDNNITTVESLNILRNKLKDQNREANRPLSDNQLKAFDIEQIGKQGRYKIPFAFPAFARKNEQMLFSMFRNQLIQQKIHGKQVVQVAELGGIDSNNELSFVTPTGEKVKEGVIGNIQYAEVAVSADVAEMLGINVAEYYQFEGNVGVKGDLLHEISDEAKTLIGFRIPTSGKNLMIPLKVKRILPKNYKASFVVPGRITTQMGSDFDIDTLFVYAPRNRRVKGKLERIPYNLKNINKNSRHSLENLYFDLVESVLSHPEHFSEMIRPLEGGQYKTLAEQRKVKIDEQKASRYQNPNSPFVNIDYQLRNRDGNIGIGVYSNALMGLSTLQHMGIPVNFKKAISVVTNKGTEILEQAVREVDGQFIDIEGNFIEHNITEHQVAAIENAKNPFMHYVNDNVTTMPATIFMLFSGLDMVRTTEFRTHPAIIELVNQYENIQAKPYQIEEIAKSIVGEQTYENAKVPTLNFVQGLNSHSDAEILRAFVQYHKSGNDLIKLNNIITPNRISDMSSNAALAEYFDTIDYINSKKFDTFTISAIQDMTKVETLDSLYPMNQAYRNAIHEAVAFTDRFFPFNSNAVRQLKHDLYNLVGRDTVSKDVHKAYHDFLFAYMVSVDHTGQHTFDADYAKDLLFEEKNSPSLVTRILDLKKEDPYFAQNAFIRSLTNNRYNVDNKVKTFDFNSPVHYDKNESNIYTEALLDLFRNEKYTQIVNDLAYYSIFTTGFSPAPNSFINLIPIEVWQSLDLSDFFYRNLQSLQDGDVINFTDLNYEFIYNNVDTKGLLYSLRLEEGEHNKHKLEFTASQARQVGAMQENMIRPFTRVYNKDNHEFDLWVYQGKTNKAGTDYYIYQKSGKKGDPYRLKEIGLRGENNDTIGSILSENRTGPILVPNINQSVIEESSQTDVSNSQYYEGNITPSENTIFVFGSNPEGRHGKGAAETAIKQFGLQKGKLKSESAFGLLTKDLMGYGNFDKSILKVAPFGGVYYESEGATFWKDRIEYKNKTYKKVDDGTTTNGFIKEGSVRKGTKFTRASEGGKWLHKLPKEFIQVKIAELYEEALNNPAKQYKIAYNKPVTTKSLNGYTGLEMIEMFNNAGVIPNNIIFSKEWFDTGKLNITGRQGELFQKKSPMYNYRSKNIRLKETFENIGIPVEITIDPSLEDYGKVSYENGTVKITLRNENVESQVHEFGHIYVNLLGQNSDIVKQGINQLRGTELWNEIHDLYRTEDGYTKDQIEVEVLVTAIGQEGAKYLQQPWWKAWWNRMINRVKEVLGIDRNIAQQLAIEMLNNDLRPVDTSQFVFDRTLKHKDLMKYERGKRITQDLILSLDRQIESLRELSNDQNKSVQVRKNLRSRLEKIIDDQRGIKEQIQGTRLFIEESYNQMQRIAKEMDQIRYDKPENFMRKAGEMIQIMNDYEVLDMIKHDAGDMLGQKENAQTAQLLQYAIDFRERSKEDLNDLFIPKMAEELSAKVAPEIMEQQNKRIKNLEEKGVEADLNLNRTIQKTRRYKQIKSDKNLSDAEKKHQILELAKDTLRSAIPNSQNIETYLREAVNGNRYFLWMVDPVIYSDDQAIQLFTLFVKDSLADARRDSIEWRRRFEDIHNRFVKETGRQGWDNEKAYEFMLEDISYETYENGERKTISRKSFVQPFDMDRFNKKFKSVINDANKKFNVDTENFNEWKEENTELYKGYKKYIYDYFYKDHMSPVEGWETIRDKQWNELASIKDTIQKLGSDEQMTQEMFEKKQNLLQDEQSLENWFEDNFVDYNMVMNKKPTIPKGELSRPSDNYKNQKYEQLQANPTLKKFYDEFMQAYREIQDIYGSWNFNVNAWDTHSYYTPSVRKKGLDRLVENGMLDTAKDYFKDFKVLDTDDVYQQYVDERKRVPIYYANAVDSKDVSNDVPTTLMLMAKQAEEYKQLTNMLGHVHVMRNILENRSIPKQDSLGNNLFDKLANMRGWVRTVNDSIPANQTRQYKQWSDWIDTIFYGMTQEKQMLGGTNIELNKAMNKLNTYSAFNVFPFNFLQGVANVFIGNSYIIQEAIAGEHFTKGDYAKAQQLYFQATYGLVRDMGLTSPRSKVGQLIELFDVQEGMTMRDMVSSVFNTRAKNLTTLDQAFFLQRSGELQMALTPFLAIMNNIKVTDASGVQMSLFDAYEIKSNGRIGLKKGVNLSKQEMNRITNKVNALNRSMQGIYDRFNSSWLKKRWYGKPLLLFRSWLLPTYRRFWGYNNGDLRYDHEMGSLRDGIYKTAFYFMKEMAKGERQFDLSLYKDLNDYERRNLQKFATHMAMIAITFGAIMALRSIEDDEVSKEAYYALYWSSRLRSELMIFLNPVTEGTKLLRSPAASISILQKSVRFFRYVIPAPIQLIKDGELEAYERRVGRFPAGTPKLYKATRDMIPGINAFDNSLSPEEAYKWYTRLF